MLRDAMIWSNDSVRVTGVLPGRSVAVRAYRVDMGS